MSDFALVPRRLLLTWFHSLVLWVLYYRLCQTLLHGNSLFPRTHPLHVPHFCRISHLIARSALAVTASAALAKRGVKIRVWDAEVSPGTRFPLHTTGGI